VDEKAAAKAFVGQAGKNLRQMIEVLKASPTWDEASLDIGLKEWVAREGLLFKDVAQAARVALTGRSASPSLHQVLAILGKDASIARLERGAVRAEAAT
jgi:glutamyl-tRNA synthetase